MKIIIEANLDAIISDSSLRNELIREIEHYIYEYMEIESVNTASILENFVLDMELKVTASGRT